MLSEILLKTKSTKHRNHRKQHNQPNPTQPNLSLHLSFSFPIPKFARNFKISNPRDPMNIVEQNRGGMTPCVRVAAHDDQRWITANHSREARERLEENSGALGRFGRDSRAANVDSKKVPRLRFHAGGRDRRGGRAPAIHNVGQLTSLEKSNFLAQNFRVNVASSVFNLVQKIFEQYFVS